MPVEFECKDIGNQNCGFKTEANTPEELITKVNQHVRSAHGMNPTDAQERVERAIKEKEPWRQSSSMTGDTGSMTNETVSPTTSYGQGTSSSWNQPASQGMQHEQTTTAGRPESTNQPVTQPGQPGWQTQRFGEQQGEQYRQTGQETSTMQNINEQTGTQSGMSRTDNEFGSGTMSGQRGRNVTQTTTETVEDEEVEE